MRLLSARTAPRKPWRRRIAGERFAARFRVNFATTPAGPAGRTTKQQPQPERHAGALRYFPTPRGARNPTLASLSTIFLAAWNPQFGSTGRSRSRAANRGRGGALEATARTTLFVVRARGGNRGSRVPVTERKLGEVLTEKEARQYFHLNDMLFEFAKLFEYDDKSERAIAIVGPVYLDMLLSAMLTNFLVADDEEVTNFMRPDRGALGTFGARVAACYCFGLIGPIVRDDLRTIAKVRNRFAHDLLVTFSDQQVAAYCRNLRWHKEALGEPPAGATARDLFQVGVNQLGAHLSGLVGLARFDKRSMREHG